jgi:hypothetical protein
VSPASGIVSDVARRSITSVGLWFGLGPCLGLCLGLGGCQEPPSKPVDRVPGPVLEREQGEAFKREAHEQAFDRALPVVLAAFETADPLAAYQVGRAEAAIPPLTPGARLLLANSLEAAGAAVDEIDESYLPPGKLAILRAIRLQLAMLADELERPQLRRDPMVALRSVEAVLAELRYRLVHDDCDATCEGLAALLAEALPGAHAQLNAASHAAVIHAGERATELAERSRELAERPLVERREGLAQGLEQLASALEDHGLRLATLAVALADAELGDAWTSKPAPLRPGGAISRLPDVVGAPALTRRVSSEEWINLQAWDIAVIHRHLGRWEALRSEWLGADAPADPSSTRVDEARCEAALARVTARLAVVPEVEAPSLDCARLVALAGERSIGEGELVLEILDLGVIEPQRHAARRAELPEFALITGRWSAQVHTHLRRVMLLAKLPEPAARARALDAGQAALCRAYAALWEHAELGERQEFAELGRPKLCASLDDHRPAILGDPRAALAGYALAKISDEPSRMVGFDRYFWAPIGLMPLFATPIERQPEAVTHADAPAPAPLVVEVEPL